jgi:hypothetical protein
MARGFRDENGGYADVVEFELDLLSETDRAWRVFDGSLEMWLPKSQVERHGNHFMVPRWLAEQRGLI